MLDQALNQTTPWYPGEKEKDSDSPDLPLPTGNATGFLSLTFQDYVMWQAPQGLWVPMGTFDWSVNATAAPNPNGPKEYKLTPGNPTGLTAGPTVSHMAWPGSWNSVAGDPELIGPIK